MKYRLLARGMAGAVGLATLAVPLVAHAAPPAPPFHQCPSIGASPSCGVLIVINADGSTSVLDDGSVGPYDGIEDTLVGVVNNNAATLSKVHLRSSQAIFGFDGDGICIYVPNSGCGATGYEGPNTKLVASDIFSGDVIFPAGLQPGAATYFSLEERVTAADVTIPVASGSGTAVRIVAGTAAPALSDTGTVTNGINSTSLIIVPPNPILSASALSASTDSRAGSATSSSHIGNITVGGFAAPLTMVLGPNTLPTEFSATAVQSSASASCGANGSVVRGGSASLANLHLAGSPPAHVEPAPVTPNQTAVLPGGSVIVFNEQVLTAKGIIVRAAHVYGPAGIEVIVAESVASVTGC